MENKTPDVDDVVVDSFTSTTTAAADVYTQLVLSQLEYLTTVFCMDVQQWLADAANTLLIVSQPDSMFVSQPHNLFFTNLIDDDSSRIVLYSTRQIQGLDKIIHDYEKEIQKACEHADEQCHHELIRERANQCLASIEQFVLDAIPEQYDKFDYVRFDQDKYKSREEKYNVIWLFQNKEQDPLKTLVSFVVDVLAARWFSKCIDDQQYYKRYLDYLVSAYEHSRILVFWKLLILLLKKFSLVEYHRYPHVSGMRSFFTSNDKPISYMLDSESVTWLEWMCYCVKGFAYYCTFPISLSMKYEWFQEYVSILVAYVKQYDIECITHWAWERRMTKQPDPIVFMEAYLSPFHIKLDIHLFMHRLMSSYVPNESTIEEMKAKWLVDPWLIVLERVYFDQPKQMVQNINTNGVRHEYGDINEPLNFSCKCFVSVIMSENNRYWPFMSVELIDDLMQRYHYRYKLGPGSTFTMSEYKEMMFIQHASHFVYPYTMITYDSRTHHTCLWDALYYRLYELWRKWMVVDSILFVLNLDLNDDRHVEDAKDAEDVEDHKQHKQSHVLESSISPLKPQGLVQVVLCNIIQCQLEVDMAEVLRTHPPPPEVCNVSLSYEDTRQWALDMKRYPTWNAGLKYIDKKLQIRPSGQKRFEN